LKSIHADVRWLNAKSNVDAEATAYIFAKRRLATAW